jgi:hypothetical protein
MPKLSRLIEINRLSMIPIECWAQSPRNG